MVVAERAFGAMQGIWFFIDADLFPKLRKCGFIFMYFGFGSDPIGAQSDPWAFGVRFEKIKFPSLGRSKWLHYYVRVMHWGTATFKTFWHQSPFLGLGKNPRLRKSLAFAFTYIVDVYEFHVITIKIGLRNAKHIFTQSKIRYYGKTQPSASPTHNNSNLLLFLENYN